MTKNYELNKIKENISETLLAMVGREGLNVEFSDVVENDFSKWDQSLVLENKIILPQVVDGDITLYRAASDLAASYCLFHDDKIIIGSDLVEEEKKLFDEFEKVRVMLNMRTCYVGAWKNILAALEKTRFSSLALVLIEEFVKGSCFDRLSMTHIEILQKIKNLAEKIYDQEKFAKGVVEIIELLRKKSAASEAKKDEVSENDANEKVENFGVENIEAEMQNMGGEEQGKKEITEKIEEKAELKDDKANAEVQIKLGKSSFEENGIKFENPYKIYSAKFDEIIFPQKLVSKNELEMLRDQLELKIAKLDKISKKMALKLKKKLLSKKNSFLEYDANSGILDRKKFTKIVTDPLIDNIYLDRKNHEYQDTALTILLDNSGSMRGNPIVVSALACEIIAEILEKFSIKTEIIGFTTADWRGGRVRKLWESNGKPKNPGRLNELRHIIYKSFNQNFKRAKINLALMLKEGILKENIDGEALLYARSRLMQQDEKRKILMVISDGTPVDDSTISANDNDILSKHLEHVINKIEKQSKIEIVAIGIGHKIDEFYHNSISIKSVEELGDAMIEKLAKLL